MDTIQRVAPSPLHSPKIQRSLGWQRIDNNRVKFDTGPGNVLELTNLAQGPGVQVARVWVSLDGEDRPANEILDAGECVRVKPPVWVWTDNIEAHALLDVKEVEDAW